MMHQLLNDSKRHRNGRKCIIPNVFQWTKESGRKFHSEDTITTPSSLSHPSPPIFPGDSIEKWQLFFYYYHSYYWTLAVGELLPKLSDFFAVSHFEKLGTDRTAVENTGFSWNGRLNFAFLWRQERSRTNEKWMLGENWRVSQNSGMKIKITALSVRCTFFFSFSSWKKKLII